VLDGTREDITSVTRRIDPSTVTIGLVLGKPPDRSPVIHEVAVLLRRLGATVRVHVQDRDGTLVPPWLLDADTVALRGLRDPTLRALLPAERAGACFADPPSAVLAARARASVHDRLAAAGIAVPTYRWVASWSEVAAIAAARRVVIKHASGEVGRGRHVVAASEVLPREPPFPGPYLVEDHVAADSPEVKLYRFGDRVVAARAAEGTEVTVPEGHVDLAGRVGDALALSMVGIDVLHGPDGPTVVDVNPFPSARRIGPGAMLVSGHLLDLAAPPRIGTPS
jgi:glutathione synthase/RimK-type ligase-like ATP-grasp enzyme